MSLRRKATRTNYLDAKRAPLLMCINFFDKLIPIR